MKKKLLFFCCTALFSSTIVAQDCSTDPGPYTNYMVAGDFTQNDQTPYLINDVVMLNPNGNNLSIDVLTSSGNGQRVLRKGTNSTFYNLNNVNGRMVKGDFDNDGHIDDFILIYKTGPSSMRFDIFKSDGAAAPSFTQSTFYTLNGYDPDKITGRVVSGDFDNDGNWDDIAAFYDYGGGQTRIHVFKSTGTTMQYSGSGGWWSTFGYTAGQVTGRVVSGDFDRDGDVDDIAAFYDYGGGQTRIHVWLSNGSSLSYQGSTGWWSSTGYSSSQITNRVLSLNIDRDSKEYDDIAVFYDYGGGQTRMHVFESNGSSFGYSNGPSGWWSTYGYTASQITGKIVEHDSRSFSWTQGKASDIIAFYDYGSNTTKYHMWEAKNPAFGSPYVVYGHHNFCAKKMVLPNEEIDVNVSNDLLAVTAFPNPVETSFTLKVPASILEDAPQVFVYNSVGQLVMSSSLTEERMTIDLSNENSGIYIVKIIGDQTNQTLRISKK
jgi:hypothetical protein